MAVRRGRYRVAALEWGDWFNNRRLLEPIGNIPPVEFEAACYEQENSHAMVARLNLRNVA